MKQAGFSLLELLLVLAASSTFLFALYQLFFHQQQQYYQQQIILQTQENTRLALHLLKKNLQATGEAGCLPVSNILFHNNVSNLSLDLKIAKQHGIYGFHGHDGGWTPALPWQLNGKVAANTDVIWVEKASYERANLLRQMQSSQDVIEIGTAQLFEPNDILLISDCMHADLFTLAQVENHSAGARLYPNHLSRQYGADAQVMRWQVDTYYLASHSQDPNVLALYQKTLLPERSAVELVSHFDRLRVEYAVLLQNTPMFLTADQVNNWPQVRGLVLNIGQGLVPSSQLNVVLYN